jgi:hypothetical protein
MARPIRIPGSDPGGGSPSYLPSPGLAAAGPLATAQAGQRALAGAGDLADKVTRARAVDAAKRDELTHAKEKARSEALLKAGLAATATELGEYELSEGFTEEGWRERYRAGIEKAYRASGEGVTDEGLIASRAGELSGLLDADPTALLAGVRERRSGVAVDTIAENALRSVNEGGALDDLPEIAISAAEDLDRIAADFPSRRRDVEQSKARIFSGLRNQYTALGGEEGEIRFYSDLWDGDFDHLGPGLAAAAKADSIERTPKILSDIMEKSALGDNDSGDLTENGGRFPVMDFKPDVTGLLALREELDYLPEGDRERAYAQIDAAIAAKERRADLHRNVIEPFMENGGTLPPLGRDNQLSVELDSYIDQVVKPWLNDTRRDEAGNLVIPTEEKAATIRRTIMGTGSIPPSLGAWILEQGTRVNADPDIQMAIAQALDDVGPLPARYRVYRDSQRERVEEQAGILPVDTREIPADQLAVYDYMVRHADQDAATAYTEALRLREAGIGAGSRRSGAGGGKGGFDPIMERFGPESEADRKAVAATTKAVDGLRERMDELGYPVDDISPELEGRLAERITSKYLERLEYMQEGEALAAATDAAIREWGAENPPVTIFGRVYRDKGLKDLTGGLPPRAIEEEIVADLRGRGVEVTDEVVGRLRVARPPSMDLEPNQFMVADPETGDIHGPFTIDPETSIYQRTRDSLALLGMGTERAEQQSIPGAPYPLRLDSERAPAVLKAQMFDLALADPKTFRRIVTGSPQGALAEPGMEDIISAAKETPLFPDGQPIFTRSPKLMQAWQEAFNAEYGPLSRNDPVFDWRGLKVYRRFKSLPKSEIRERAARNGDDAVRTLLEFEFKGASAEDVMKFLRTGRLPSEPADPLQPTRGAVP